jgi:hypothetical protein
MVTEISVITQTCINSDVFLSETIRDIYVG